MIHLSLSRLLWFTSHLRPGGLRFCDERDLNPKRLATMWNVTTPGKPVVPRPLQVFLCHSSGDKAAIRQLYDRLEQDGVDPWLDEKKLIPGQVWRTEIEKAVRASDAVIVCLSRTAVTKEGFVQREIRVALEVADEKPEGTIFIIPARLEHCDVPARLQEWQWVNLFE